jgi:hypothetical protein
VLLRRLYFDLIGLPPSPDELQEFLQRLDRESLDAVWVSVVDDLLQRPAYGERWARHWLDVARFGESSGKEANIAFPYAWRYRDYVIDCFQRDVPFDRFIVEQIAGDLLPADSPQERARLLIATGFLAIGTKNLDEANPLQFAADVIDEQIDTVSRAFIGQSIACARCHDHKTDPFPMDDYYALAGIFASTQTFFGTAVSPANRMAGDPLPLPVAAGQAILHPSISPQRVTELKKQLASLQQEREEGMRSVQEAIKTGQSTEDKFALRDALRIFWRSGAIEGELEKYDEHGQSLPLGMGVVDRKAIVDAPFLEAGDILQPQSPVPRRLPSGLGGTPRGGLPSDQSGRLQLAHWLADPAHPTTARVIANRIWLHLTGEGLVRTVDDFGATGERPTHPELLDYLAASLIDHQWSVRRLIRSIVLSRTYRQASTYEASAYAVDPDNLYHWRANKRRLEAEAIRDAMLAVSGELDLQRPLASLVAREIGDRPISLIGLDSKLPPDLDGARHRSIYLPVLRDRLPDVLATFDFAEPSFVSGQRDVTNVPTQALYLMNSPFVIQRAMALAGRLQQEVGEFDDRAVQWLYRYCLARDPTPAELLLAKKFRANQAAGEDLLVSYCQALLSSAEFRYLD